MLACTRKPLTPAPGGARFVGPCDRELAAYLEVVLIVFRSCWIFTRVLVAWVVREYVWLWGRLDLRIFPQQKVGRGCATC
jgi:hypothetical protein